MAGTEELDRLLEELRLTSLQMTSGLPPPSSHPSPRTYSTGYTPRFGSQYQSGQTIQSSHSKYQQHQHRSGGSMAPRSSSAVASFGSSAMNANQHPSYHPQQQQQHSSSFQSRYQSSTTGGGSFSGPTGVPLQSERRTETFTKSSQFYPPTYRSHPSSPSPLSPYSSANKQQHHTTFTTVLKPHQAQRPTTMQRQLSQVHLTIDPNCGTSQTNSMINGHDSANKREHLLETELTAARRELAQLRRAMSLIEERQRSSIGSPTTTPGSLRGSYGGQLEQHQQLQQQFSTSSATSASYHQQHTQQNTMQRAPRSVSSSTFQRISNRQEGPYNGTVGGNRGLTGNRTWNLRSRNLGSESDLVYKRTTSVSNSPGQMGYSAHRERLKQEREQHVMRQQNQTRHRQLAASTLGLHEQQQHLQRQTRHQQQYRSLSAVNTNGNGETFEEVETIALQPIGRGVQDIDSRAGSMTTLNRGPGGSMTDGLHRTDETSRSSLARRGYASTQYLSRQPSNSDLLRQNALHQSHTTLATDLRTQPAQPTRFGTSTTLVNRNSTTRINGSTNNLSTVSSTLVPASAVVHVQPTSKSPVNGWSSGSVIGNEVNDLDAVQRTAPIWYRPQLSRELAINILRQQTPGNFLIRDSTSFKGAFGLAVKVATLPPKVTPKSNDLQAELVRHYLIEVVHHPERGVRLKGFASEPVFPSLAALIHQHTQDALALPCRLVLPTTSTIDLPSSGISAMPPLVIGQTARTVNGSIRTESMMNGQQQMDTATVTSSGSVLGRTPSEMESVSPLDGIQLAPSETGTPVSVPVQDGTDSSVPFVCVLRESTPTGSGQNRSNIDVGGGGMTFRCLMLGSVDTPQWKGDTCFSRAVDQLIPLTTLTATECDHGISRVRYTEVQLHISAHDGVTIIDLNRKLFLRRHLPNQILVYCGLETRKKEFIHPEHQALGISHPALFGIVVRKGISECTTYVFSECDPAHTAESVIRHIQSTYAHLLSR